jgi:ABC-type sugar transport system permease subunit
MAPGRALSFLLVSPLLLTLALFLAYPTWCAVVLAFTDPLTHTFPSMSNFELLRADPLFWQAVVNNAVLPILSVCVEISMGLALALFLSLRFRGRRLLRTIVVLPFALPEIVVLSIMRYIFTARGYANAALATAGLGPVDWLTPGHPFSLVTVVLVDAWHVTPVVFLLLLAGLAAIPDDVQEAARMDGAGAMRRFWFVTLPLLRPALFAALLLRGVDALRMFATPLVLTGVEGVPVLSTYAYHQWSDYGNDMAAAAAACVLALLSVTLTLPLLRRRVTA